MKKILFIGLLFVLAGTGVWSQEVSDSVRIHYRRGYRGVDPDYHNNRSELERLSVPCAGNRSRTVWNVS